MGTRADFYVGRGTAAEWLGSIAYDGHPEQMPRSLRTAKTEKRFRTAISRLLAARSDATHPDQGWPWPWENSQLTDYACAFDADRVYASAFGCQWFAVDEPKPELDTTKKVEFPDMTAVQRVAQDSRSGLLFVSVRGVGG